LANKAQGKAGAESAEYGTEGLARACVARWQGVDMDVHRPVGPGPDEELVVERPAAMTARPDDLLGDARALEHMRATRSHMVQIT